MWCVIHGFVLFHYLLSSTTATTILICGDKAKRGKACGSFTTCAECVECESDWYVHVNLVIIKMYVRHDLII